jgi:hypothetical protein
MTTKKLTGASPNGVLGFAPRLLYLWFVDGVQIGFS